MIENMKKYWTIFRVELANMSAYKGAALVWLLFDLFWIAAFPFIWYTVISEQGGTIEGWNTGGVVRYYIFMAFLNNLVFMHPEVHSSNEIYEGRLTNYIVRPVNYVIFTFLHEAAWKVMRTILFVPIFVALIFLGQRFVSLEVGTQAPLAVLGVLLGTPILFLTGLLIAFTSFWLEDSHIAKTIFWISSGLFGGQFAPLTLMPPVFQTIAAYLPFKYAIYFPLQLLSQSVSRDAVVLGFIGQAAWIGVLLIAVYYVWGRGLRVYNAVGR